MIALFFYYKTIERDAYKLSGKKRYTSNYENYKNTIYWLAEKYANNGAIFKPRENDWEKFADFLLVDSKTMKEKLNNGQWSDDITNEYQLFNVLIKTFFAVKAYKYLDTIKYKTSDEDIIEIHNVLKDICFWMSSMNSDISTYMCMDKGFFSWDYCPQDWQGYNPQKEIDNIILYCSDDVYAGRNSELFNIINYIEYELITRINSLFFIGILLIVKVSPYFQSEIKNMAEELYDYLIVIFKNSQLLGLNINVLRPYKGAEGRGKKDNTTQLLCVYAYNNFDSYCLRLDLPHKGVNFVHYNNRTPGDGKGNIVESCIFTIDEYKRIIEEYREKPNIKNFFIKYGKIFALKEIGNCNFKSEEEIKIFKKIETNGNHKSFSSKIYFENDIINFIDILSFFFPSCKTPIDNSYEFASKCFSYNKIMFYNLLLNLSQRSFNEKDKEKVPNIISKIVDNAESNGFIGKGDFIHDELDIDLINYIIELEKESIPLILNIK